MAVTTLLLVLSAQVIGTWAAVSATSQDLKRITTQKAKKYRILDVSLYRCFSKYFGVNYFVITYRDKIKWNAALHAK